MPESKFESVQQPQPIRQGGLFEGGSQSRQDALMLISPSLALALKSAAEEAGEPLAVPRRDEPEAPLRRDVLGSTFTPAGEFVPAYGARSKAELEAERERRAVQEDFSRRLLSAVVMLSQRAAVAGLGESVIARNGKPLREFARALRDLMPMTAETAQDVLPWIVADLSTAVQQAPLQGGWGELVNHPDALVLRPRKIEPRARERRVRVIGGLTRRGGLPRRD